MIEDINLNDEETLTLIKTIESHIKSAVKNSNMYKAVRWAVMKTFQKYYVYSIAMAIVAESLGVFAAFFLSYMIKYIEDEDNNSW